MSESLHELEAALADAQREAALAEDEYTERAARWNAKPTMKRHLKLWDAFHAREDAHHKFARAQEAVERARRKEAEHPPLKEGLHLRVTDEDLHKLRAERKLFDVAVADAMDELDNPAAPIVEVEAPDQPRVDEDELRSMTDYVADHREDGDRQPDDATETPVVTLAPVNGEGRFVPIGTIADGSAEDATVYLEQGYTRNEQGAYEYDGPVGEQPSFPNWKIDAPGQWTAVVGPASRTPKTVETDDTDLPYLYPNEKWTGSPDQEPLPRDTYMTLTGGPDPRTKAAADEAMGPTAEEQAVIDAAKAAQAKVGADAAVPMGIPLSWSNPMKPSQYQGAFAKAGDVPSAPAEHVTGVTNPESVTVNTERDMQQFGSDTVKLKSQTITSEFTMTEAEPKHFQTIFPNARVVIGSDGKVNITANTMAQAAEHVAESKPTTPEGKLLTEAAQIIGHDRNDQYGNAEDSFGVIAEFWSTWLTARRNEVVNADFYNDEIDGVTLTAADVANMLGLMKKARTAVGGHKRDNYVDEAGYVALAERCEAKGSGL